MIKHTNINITVKWNKMHTLIKLAIKWTKIDS